LHRFNDDVQKNPVVASQSLVPHTQAAPLSAMPSVVAHVGVGVHRSLDVSQKSPVACVQAPEVSQKQGAGLAVAPSPWAQGGPVKVPTVKLVEVLHRLMRP